MTPDAKVVLPSLPLHIPPSCTSVKDCGFRGIKIFSGTVKFIETISCKRILPYQKVWIQIVYIQSQKETDGHA